MKTYFNKRYHNKIIEDVHQLCRLCLARAENAVPIFEQVDTACAALPMRIMICVGYEITKEDSLPSIVCINCYQELEGYYKFRKKCADSYLKLKAHLNTIRLKERIQNPSEDKTLDEIEPLVIADVYNVEDPNVHEETNMASSSVDDAVNYQMKEETTEIKVIEQSNEESPDISAFLSAILVELGILVKNDQGFVVQDQGTSFQLETGDDDQVVFELVEEEDEVVPDEVPMTISESNNKPQETELMVKYESMVETKPQVIEIKLEEESTEKTKGKSKMVRKRKNLAGVNQSEAWCGTCRRTFSSRSAARRHAAAHSGERPHACECGRTFTQKAVLERHRLVHQAVRPFACVRCPRSYTQRAALTAHARRHAHAHHAPQPLALHTCALCDSTFLYASGLSRHMITHSGRTFSCAVCERLFNDKSSLLRHSRNAHPTAQPTRLGASTPLALPGASDDQPPRSLIPLALPGPSDDQPPGVLDTPRAAGPQ